jgi:ABC-type lipoprotein release transport system permease subunit
VPTPFKVVAVFRTGSVQADTRAYGAITDVQRVNRTPNQVNEIAVRLHDHTQAAALANTWSALSAEKVGISRTRTCSRCSRCRMRFASCRSARC